MIEYIIGAALLIAAAKHPDRAMDIAKQSIKNTAQKAPDEVLLGMYARSKNEISDKIIEDEMKRRGL